MVSRASSSLHPGRDSKMILETKKANLTAQHVCESTGWKRDDVFYRYYLPV
ncbi:MAG TPA: hypothetical protein VLV18_00150 [Terriglobales bacterium]|nr:hypothetical protein [Terriglobales bacterium]